VTYVFTENEYSGITGHFFINGFARALKNKVSAIRLLSVMLNLVILSFRDINKISPPVKGSCLVFIPILPTG